MANYRDALLSVTLVNEAGDTHELNTVGSIFEVMHVCQAFGLIPDENPGDGGVIFVQSRTGSFGSLRPVDPARDLIEHFMSEDCRNNHNHDDDLF